MKIYRIAIDVHDSKFKEWFGKWDDPNAFSSKGDGSPVSHSVDKDGNPQVMFHGTTKDFEDFEVGLEGTNSNVFGNYKVTRNAIFFTKSPEHAGSFTSSGGETDGGNIRPVYLSVKNPLDFTKGVPYHILDEFESVGVNPRWLMNFSWEHLDDDDGALLVNACKTLGYDGIIFIDEDPETRESIESWAVFDKSQIKSVYGAL